MFAAALDDIIGCLRIIASLVMVQYLEQVCDLRFMSFDNFSFGLSLFFKRASFAFLNFHYRLDISDRRNRHRLL